MDTVDRQTRSKIMASVGQKDTGAELLLRAARGSKGYVFMAYDILEHGCWDVVGSYPSPTNCRAIFLSKGVEAPKEFKKQIL